MTTPPTDAELAEMDGLIGRNLRLTLRDAASLLAEIRRLRAERASANACVGELSNANVEIAHLRSEQLEAQGIIEQQDVELLRIRSTDLATLEREVRARIVAKLRDWGDEALEARSPMSLHRAADRIERGDD